MNDTAVIDEFPGYTFYRDGRCSNKYGQFIGKVNPDSYGNTIAFIDKNGKKHNKRIHIMIMWAFSGEPANGRDVDHINSKKDDNRYENLQYLDRKSHNIKTRKENPEIRICKARPIQGIDKDGNIKKFISIKEASEFIDSQLNIRTSYDKITNSIKKNEFYKGYKFSYSNTENLEGEIWKKPNIDGIDSYIEVSNYGRVKHKNGKITYEFNSNNKINNKAENLEWSDPVKQSVSWQCKVHLQKDGLITTFDSIKEANEFLNVKHGVHNCLSGTNKTVKGYTVVRDSEKWQMKDIDKKTSSCGTQIYQLDNDKKIIKEFPSIYSAIRELFPNLEISKYTSKSTGIRRSMICGCKSIEYYWQYKNPPENINELRKKYGRK